jgi:predicted nucleotidyltransferase
LICENLWQNKKLDTMAIKQQLKEILGNHPDILLCILFGSLANGQETFNSDLDIAVAKEKSLQAAEKQVLIEELAVAFGRPVDLIDLQATSGTLLHQILTTGELIFCHDHHLYAEIIKKMLFNQSDFMPYHDRILKERRERWINE